MICPTGQSGCSDQQQRAVAGQISEMETCSIGQAGVRSSPPCSTYQIGGPAEILLVRAIHGGSAVTVALDQLTDSLQNGRWARGLVLDGTQLAGAALTGLQGDGLNLRHSDLSRGVLSKSHLVACDFSRANLAHAELDRATIRMCTFDQACGEQLSAVGAVIEDCVGAGVDLSGADLRGAQLTDTSFPQSRLRQARLDGVDACGVSFRGADLAGASLRGVSFDDADLRGADLTGADLRGSRFHGADFRGAIVNGCIWTETDCAGALFDLAESTESAPTTSESVFRHSDDGESLLNFALAASVNDALTDVRRPAELGALLDSLHEAATTGHLDAEEVMSRLDPLLEILERSPDDEPPEEWRAWLKPLIEAASAPPASHSVGIVPDGIRPAG